MKLGIYIMNNFNSKEYNALVLLNNNYEIVLNIIIQYLLKQDKMLNEEINISLKEIIQQNKEIINLLKNL